MSPRPGQLTITTTTRVVAAMVGRSLGELFPPKSGAAADKEPVLSLRGLTAEGGAPPVDLDLRPGEIAGLAGLVGSGRTELALAIFGAARGAGTVELSGTTYGKRTPGRSLAAGLAMLTEDRKANGLFPDASVAWNFAASTLGKGARALALSPRNEEERSRSVVERFSVVVDHVGQPISALSGGNQQKVLIGRLLENDPKNPASRRADARRGMSPPRLRFTAPCVLWPATAWQSWSSPPN